MYVGISENNSDVLDDGIEFDGMYVGNDVGVSDNDFNGLDDGISVGEKSGLEVGNEVGIAVNKSDGLDVGIDECITWGAKVGWAVGGSPHTQLSQSQLILRQSIMIEEVATHSVIVPFISLF